MQGEVRLIRGMQGKLLQGKLFQTNLTHVSVEAQTFNLNVGHYLNTSILYLTCILQVFDIVCVTCTTLCIAFSFLLHFIVLPFVLQQWNVHSRLYSLRHSFSHSAGKQRRGFLLLLYGYVRRQELEKRAAR